jgi:ribosome-binding ATPase YchF (GTP1/OBG family)
VQTVETELILSDLETLERELPRAERAAKRGEPDAEKRVEVLERIGEALDEGRPARAVDLPPGGEAALEEVDLLTLKPVLYVANVDEEALLGASEAAGELREVADRRGGRFLEVCAEIESELAELDPGARDEMLGELGVDQPALRALIRETYDLLGLQSYFTAGPVEIRAWAIPKGAAASDAADAIHSEFEESFIRAEVYRLDDLRDHGSVEALRNVGEIRIEGQDYEVQDGDIMYFRHDA